MSVRCEWRGEVAEIDGKAFYHECFWADEHVHVENHQLGGFSLMAYRNACTCVHGISKRFYGYRTGFGDKPTTVQERVAQHMSRENQKRIAQ